MSAFQDLCAKFDCVFSDRAAAVAKLEDELGMQYSKDRVSEFNIRVEKARGVVKHYESTASRLLARKPDEAERARVSDNVTRAEKLLSDAEARVELAGARVAIRRYDEKLMDMRERLSARQENLLDDRGERVSRRDGYEQIMPKMCVKRTKAYLVAHLEHQIRVHVKNWPALQKRLQKAFQQALPPGGDVAQ
jgi:hypothetical protein